MSLVLIGVISSLYLNPKPFLCIDYIVVFLQGSLFKDRENCELNLGIQNSLFLGVGVTSGKEGKIPSQYFLSLRIIFF
jgi:hypothetical protein